MRSWFRKGPKVYSFRPTIQVLEERILLDAALPVQLVEVQQQPVDSGHLDLLNPAQPPGQTTEAASSLTYVLPESNSSAASSGPDAGASVVATATSDSTQTAGGSTAAPKQNTQTTTEEIKADGGVSTGAQVEGTSGSASGNSATTQPGESSLNALQQDLRTVPSSQDTAGADEAVKTVAGEANSLTSGAFSDDPFVTASQSPDPSHNRTLSQDHISADTRTEAQTPTLSAQPADNANVSAASPIPSEQPQEEVRVLIINSNLKDAQELVEAAGPGVVTVVYDGAGDTPGSMLAAIEGALAGRKADSIAFAAHHSGDGEFHLVGSHIVHSAALAENVEIQAFWRSVGGCLDADGRIDILACNLAGNDAGSLVVSQLEGLTGHLVAASDDSTGNPASGGDWVLEKGNVDVAATYFVAEQLKDFRGVLVNNAPTIQASIPNVPVSEDAADTVFSLYPNFQDVENTDAQMTYTVVGNTNPGLFALVGNPSDTKLTAGDGVAGDKFGYSVIIDGNYAIVGAPYDDDKGTDSGSAYIFEWNGSNWVQRAKLTADDGAANDNFGISVSIKDNRAIVGASYDDDKGSNSGSAYIFDRDGSSWVRQAKLTASDGALDDHFGYAVSVSGNRAIVTTPDDDDRGAYTGAAYFFSHDGANWVQQKVIASNAHYNQAFGNAVSMDGDYAIVGACADDKPNTDRGAAFVFRWDGASWVEEAKLVASDGAQSDWFGIAVSITGNRVIVGSHCDDDKGNNSGSAYIFERDGSSWLQKAKLIAADGAANDNFGLSVSLDGDYALVGAWTDDTARGTDAGSAYVFKRDGLAWNELRRFIPAGSAGGDQFGSSVAMDGNRVVIGAPYDDVKGSNAGSLYMLEVSPTTNVVGDPTNFTLNYYPNASGTAEITIRATDTEGLSVEDTFIVTISPIPDAPILDGSGNPTLTTITEEQTNNSGNTVASIIASAGGDRIMDPDPGALEGIAIYGTSGTGTWECSLDNGATWGGVGARSLSSALLLRDTDRVRFVPDGLNATTGVISFCAWDQTSGSAGALANVNTRGGATAFSGDTETAAITVTAVNDAPVNGVPWATLAVDVFAGDGGGDPQYLTVSGDYLYFTASVPAYGRELWKTDGTTDGTAMVKDINTGIAAGNPQNLTDVNGTLYFTADDGTGGRELWKTNGTEAGTVRVKDIYAGATGGDPQYLTNVNGTLFFAATDATSGRELWKTNGTEDGTVRVNDIVAGAGSSNPSNLCNVNGTLFFAAATSANGVELWKSNGTEAGTVLVKDIYAGTSNSSPQRLTAVDGTLFFAATTSAEGIELWRSDGTASGTVMVVELHGGGTSGDPRYLTNVNGTLFFSGLNWPHRELFKSTPSGQPDDPATTTTDESWNTVKVKDIFASGYDGDERDLCNVDGTLFFASYPSYQLWKSDGTEAGTVMLKTFSAHPPLRLTSVNGTVFFCGNLGSTYGSELSRSDGTAASTVLFDLYPGSSSGDFLNPVKFNNMVFFAANDGTHGSELWKAVPYSGPSGVQDTYQDTAIVFSGNKQVTISDVDDGGGTMQVTLTTNHGKMTLSTVTGLSFGFSDADGTGAGDGTLDGTMTFRGTKSAINTALNNMSFTPDTGYVGSAYLDITTKDLGCTGSGGTLTDTDRVQIYVNNKTAAYVVPNGAPVLSGTNTFTAITEDPASNPGTRVSDLISGRVTDADALDTIGIAVTGVDKVNGQWKYSIDNGATWVGFEDPIYGPPTATRATLLGPDDMIRFVPNANWNGVAHLYYRAWDGEPGYGNLHDTTATTALSGTCHAFSSFQADATITVTAVNDAPVNSLPWATFAVDIFPGDGGGDPQYLTVSGGTLYFTASVPAYGRELWKTDGTTDGTAMVKDINTGITAGNPQNLTDVNGTLYFTADDGTGGRELWKTDGSDAGTVRVKDIYVGATGSDPQYLTNMNGTLFFAATDATNGTELWKTNGTEDGTVRVEDIVVGAGSSSPSYLCNVNGTLFFAASTSANGNEIWRSDGTAGPGHTYMVKDIRSGTGNSDPAYLTGVNGTLFFAANNGVVGAELWKSDGTAGGTVLVADIHPSTGYGSNPKYLTDVNGTLFFNASRGSYNAGLYKTYWYGTELRTEPVKDLSFSIYPSDPRYLTVLDGTLFFSFNDSAGGRELWKSDGTPDGTVMVADIRPNGSSDPSYLCNVNGSLFFSAYTSTYSTELWMSDGTAAGTRLVHDIWAGNTNSDPSSLVRFKDMVFFSASDGTTAPYHGRELWKAVSPLGSEGIQDTFKDTAIIFSGNKQVTISDVDDGGGTMQVTLTANNGKMTLSTVTGLSFSFSDADGTGAGDGTLDATMTFRGTKSAINTALNNMSFTPDSGHIGSAYLDITTKDLGRTGSGGTLTDTDRVQIYVNALTSPVTLNNLAPVLTGTNTLSAINEDNVTSGGTLVSDLIAGYATDPDGPGPTGIAVVGVDEANGQWKYSINDGATWLDFDGSISNTRATLLGPTDKVRFEPNANWNGVAHLYYRAWDQKPGYGTSMTPMPIPA